METNRPPSLSPLLLCALLALPAAPLWAVPVYQMPAPKAQPQFDAQRQHCQATVRAKLQTSKGQEVDFGRVRVPDTSAPDWLEADGSSWSEHLAATLQGAGKDKLDAQFSDCRLADSEVSKAAHLNEAIDWTQLAQDVDDWLEFSQRQGVPDEDGLPQPPDARERLRLGGANEIHDNQAPGQQAGVTSAVPEPSTWMLLLGGLGYLALRLRRRAG